MGSTGARSSMYSDNPRGDREFSISGTKAFYGSLPTDSGMSKPGASNVTVQSGNLTDKNIIFQFTLSSNGNAMTIKAFNPRTKERASVQVDVKNPSVSLVEKNGSSSQKSKAAKVLKMMNESGQVSDASLPSVAGELLKRRN